MSALDLYAVGNEVRRVHREVDAHEQVATGVGFRDGTVDEPEATAAIACQLDMGRLGHRDGLRERASGSR